MSLPEFFQSSGLECHIFPFRSLKDFFVKTKMTPQSDVGWFCYSWYTFQKTWFCQGRPSFTAFELLPVSNLALAVLDSSTLGTVPSWSSFNHTCILSFNDVQGKIRERA